MRKGGGGGGQMAPLKARDVCQAKEKMIRKAREEISKNLSKKEVEHILYLCILSTNVICVLTLF